MMTYKLSLLSLYMLFFSYMNGGGGSSSERKDKANKASQQALRASFNQLKVKNKKIQK